MGEPRKVEEGDKLIYINNGWGGQFAQSEQIMKKVTKAGFTTNRGEIVRGTTYETDQASGRMFVYFGTAPNQTRAYLETPKSIAYNPSQDQLAQHKACCEATDKQRHQVQQGHQRRYCQNLRNPQGL